jgi:hypothetical protein
MMLEYRVEESNRSFLKFDDGDDDGAHWVKRVKARHMSVRHDCGKWTPNDGVYCAYCGGRVLDRYEGPLCGLMIPDDGPPRTPRGEGHRGQGDVKVDDDAFPSN